MKATLSILALLLAFHGLAEVAPRPNIVLMMVDDMGIGDTSAYLGKRLNLASDPVSIAIRTPELEKFSKQALIFTDAHAGASMCSSSRYSLLTGRFGHRPYLKRQGWLPHGPNLPMIRQEMKTLPEMLKTMGYHTACIGKYHVGMAFDDGMGKPAKDYYHRDVDFTKPLLDGPTHHGFDEFFGVPGNTEDALDTEPRIFIRNDRWSFTDRKRMVMTGFRRHAGKLFADPAWDLKQIGPVYLREVESFLQRRASEPAPFFLYYVPNANHQQLWEAGRYAIPRSINGKAVAGVSRMTDGTVGGDRADMVLENDIAFGRVLELLHSLADPRNPGTKLIDNTVVIFTSDNGPNEGEKQGLSLQAGGLRGKKASITEGGLRIPFLMYWKGRFEGGRINRTHFALTDLYATFARLLGYELAHDEARDSYNVLEYWNGLRHARDLRARLKFCHLGLPYSNDAMSIREGPEKLIDGGGVAEPGIRRGNRGSVEAVRYHHLEFDPGEGNVEWSSGEKAAVDRLSANLLRLHNRGHVRDLGVPPVQQLVVDDGWHNLRNDLDGEIGFEFRLVGESERMITHLGMWDDHREDRWVRGPVQKPNDNIIERPSVIGSGGRGLNSAHRIRLTQNGKMIAEAVIGPGEGQLSGEFRFDRLDSAVILEPGKVYRLTMSTSPDDGDLFHNPAAYDGLSPYTHPEFVVVRSVYLKDGQETAIPSYFNAHPDYWKHRLPVGPTFKFE